MSSDPTTPTDAAGEVPADPPWFAHECLMEALVATAAAFPHQQFMDRPRWERELLVCEHRKALRVAWRRMTPERRAEQMERWRQSRP